MYLTKHFQDIYTKNYTTLMKKIKEHLNIWTDIAHSWITRLMAILPNLIYRFNTIPIKISAILFITVDKIIL